MNKLDVALKLLKLLNERKQIDSGIIAQELNVSLRTAQRYLVDLSSLPCVMCDEKNHTYSLTTDYRLNSALLGMGGSGSFPPEVATYIKESLHLNEIACLMCANTSRGVPELPGMPNAKGDHRSNRQIINQWAQLLKKRLGVPGCRFP